MSGGPLQWLSAGELTALYARRELSPLEYHQYLIDHVQRREPALNALCQFAPERVLEQAAASTQP